MRAVHLDEDKENRVPIPGAGLLTQQRYSCVVVRTKWWVVLLKWAGGGQGLHQSL